MQYDLEEPMASVMATESEVFGRYVEEILVSKECKNGDGWLCCGWKYLRCFGEEKWLKIGRIGRWLCQVLEDILASWVLLMK